MNHIILIAALIVTAAFATRGEAASERLTLIEHGRSPYTIVVAENASPATKHGASELQLFLKQMTGVTLPIISDRKPMGDHEILVGDSAHLRQLKTPINFATLGKEGYVLRTVGPHLVIAGGALRGTMYGVYGLLEDHLGCRWFTPEVSRIPTYETLVIGPLDETRVPVLEYRDPYFFDALDGDWNARNRMNGASAEVGEERGGKVTYEGFSHTIFDYISPEEYFDTHPEYFSEINGKRIRERTQVCCTNEDVIRILTEKLRQKMREHPEANVFSVTQMDWDNYCQCEKCQALIDQEGTPGAPMFMMINRIADALAEEFPDKAIDTFAYQWSRKPPKTIKPRPNVIIRLCSIECCFSHPIATCDSEESTAFRKDIADWAKLCDRLWVWDYVTCFTHYLLPFPNLRVLDDNIRFFTENHVKGIFEEGNYQSFNGEMAPLRSYMMAKFLWDPQYDEKQAMNEFLQGVYGAAAGPIREYLDLLHDKVEREHIHVHIFEQPDVAYLPDEFLKTADALWEQAEAAVADRPEVSNRVRAARLSIDYTILERTKQSAISHLRIENGRYHAEVDPVFEARANRFAMVGEVNKITQLSEWRVESPAAYSARLLEPKTGWEVVSLTGKDLHLDIVPNLSGRIIGLQLPLDGLNFAYQPNPSEQGFPNVGGYGEWWGAGRRGRRGLTMVYESQVTNTPQGKTLLLMANLGEWGKLTRTIRVPAVGRSFTMESTVTNTSDIEQPVMGRVSYDFSLEAKDGVVVQMADGTVREIPTSREEAITIEAAQMAGGVTLMHRTNGLSIHLSATGANIQRAEVYRDAGTPRVIITLIAEGKLPAGDSLTLQQTVELRSAYNTQ